MTKITPFTLFALLLAAPAASAQDQFDSLIVEPAVVRLDGPGASFTLLVHGKSADALTDLTRQAKYRSEAPKIATVATSGLIRGIADGTTEIVVEAAGKTAKIKVEVQGAQSPR